MYVVPAVALNFQLSTSVAVLSAPWRFWPMVNGEAFAKLPLTSISALALAAVSALNWSR